jgi:hypothetical protein
MHTAGTHLVHSWHTAGIQLAVPHLLGRLALEEVLLRLLAAVLRRLLEVRVVELLRVHLGHVHLLGENGNVKGRNESGQRDGALTGGGAAAAYGAGRGVAAADGALMRVAGRGWRASGIG